MPAKVEIGGLQVDAQLYALVRDEIAPGTGVDANEFWTAFGKIVADLGPKNRALLEKRLTLQNQIDAWCRERRGQPFSVAEHTAFLQKIGYLVPDGGEFQVETANVDDEIGAVSGPQLVVPLDNARYALNAANARWGSLYDALYGTDVIPDDDRAEKGENYNPIRGKRVIAAAEAFLDQAVPLKNAKYSDVAAFELHQDGGSKALVVRLANGARMPLAQPDKFAGYAESNGEIAALVLRNNGLHIEIQIDRKHPIGKSHPAGIKDIVLEAAVTTIQDCEDSVAAVDAFDKVRIYRNWNGIMKGLLEATFDKGGVPLSRRLNPDKRFTAPDGRQVSLPGRSLLLVRNVGLHMYTGAVMTRDGQEVPEGFLDAMVTVIAALHDLGGEHRLNSRAGSIYIVKPKLHGPEEVAATVELFSRVENALGLPENTLKIGIMDEERRLTVNLKESIREARSRVVFINTGFLDRTGDEIHTTMQLGPMLPKGEIKAAGWLTAYENRNVEVGIDTRLTGKGQIGKGMWTMPDEMRKMVETKGAHPLAGANTAWVPSPTAATLHAMHYHAVDVNERLKELSTRPRARLSDILTPPLLDRTLTSEEIQRELNNNAQGILGYVVRWVEQGVGCSKVPDINNIGLMEDRATLRISSQHIANWLYHGIVNVEQVRETFERMAEIVDRQNQGDPHYRKMAPEFDKSFAFRAALDLVFTGKEAANGYTEPVLHSYRRQAKANSVKS